MEQYHELLKEILTRGDVQFEPRTETYTIGISAWSSRYDLREGFPLVTTKRVPPRLPFEELFWKLRGERNVKSLVDRNVPIWTANAFDRYLRNNGLSEEYPKHSQQWRDKFDEYKERIATDSEFAEEAGDLGPVYGYQWRHWKDSSGEEKDFKANMFNFLTGNEIDQLANLIKGINENPGSRYHVLSSWNVGDLKDMALGPCPFWHQFSVFGDNIDLTMVQRSCDAYLGVPFNIAQDSLLTHMIANETNLTPRFFNHQYINAHIYLGVQPRAEFWNDERNVNEFQTRLKNVEERSGYLDLKEWYLENAPPEYKGDERKDHTPLILEQLSKSPRTLPLIKVKEGTTLLDAIEESPLDCLEIEGYNPHKWDSTANMAT